MWSREGYTPPIWAIVKSGNNFEHLWEAVTAIINALNAVIVRSGLRDIVVPEEYSVQPELPEVRSLHYHGDPPAPATEVDRVGLR